MKTPLSPSTLRHGLCAAVASLLLAIPGTAQAVNGTWSSNTDGTWSNSANWAGGTVADGADFTANFSLDISGTNRQITNDPGSANATWNGTIGHLIVEDLTTPSHNWIITGNTITFNATGGISTINVVNRQLSLNSVTAGNAIEKTGAGNLSLASGSNSFNGLTITAGSVWFGDNVGASGNSRVGSGTVTLNGGALKVEGNSGRTFSRNITVTADSLIAASSGAEVTYSGIIANGATIGGLTLNESGARQLLVNQASNTFGGIGRTVRIAASAYIIADGSLGNSSNSIDLAATLSWGNTSLVDDAYSTSRAISLSATGGLSVENGSSLTLNGSLSGTNSLTLNGGAASASPGGTNFGAAGANSLIVINGNATGFSGNVTVNNGALRLGSSATLPASFGVLSLSNTTTSNLDLNGRNATFQGLSSSNVTAATIQGNATGSANTLTVNTTTFGSRTFNGTIANGGSVALNLVKNGTNTQFLGGNNSYTGNTTINGGNISLTSAGSLRFVIGGNGVNNQINGSGNVSLDGIFRLDLAGPARTVGDSWLLVDRASLAFESFTANFNVVDLSGAITFTQSSDVWTSDGPVTYRFTEATGILDVTAVVPEPSAGLLLLGGFGALLAIQRSRRRQRD
jgi:fibronectin-binding autotransporter adhesin